MIQIPEELHRLLLELYDEKDALIWYVSPQKRLDGESPIHLCQTFSGLKRCVSLVQSIIDGAYL